MKTFPAIANAYQESSRAVFPSNEPWDCILVGMVVGRWSIRVGTSVANSISPTHRNSEAKESNECYESYWLQRSKFKLLDRDSLCSKGVVPHRRITQLFLSLSVTSGTGQHLQVGLWSITVVDFARPSRIWSILRIRQVAP